jgi:hypothetical protein
MPQSEVQCGRQVATITSLRTENGTLRQQVGAMTASRAEVSTTITIGNSSVLSAYTIVYMMCCVRA